MKTRIPLVALVAILGAAAAWPRLAAADEPAVPVISNLVLTGEIQGESAVFHLGYQVVTTVRDTQLPLVEGEVAALTTNLPKGLELRRDGPRLLLQAARKGRQQVDFDFASLPVRDGDWCSTRFLLPESNLRRVAMRCDRDDLEVDFPGALGVERRKDADGKMTVTVALGAAREFTVRWKPQVKQLAGELAVTCDANTIVSASVGALRMDMLFTYRIVQGALTRLAFDVPPELNLTQVRGVDIREWTLENPTPQTRRLVISLNRPKEERYQLSVEGERVLPAFPCKFNLPLVAPLEVIRTSGFLLIGTDSAVKLMVNKSAGLTQVDHAAFPDARLDTKQARPIPVRSAFAYQYASMPYQLELGADDIVTALHSEERLVLGYTDNDLTLQAAVELDVRDAPAREVVVAADPAWVVANVTGENVADYDVREEASNRLVRVYFREAALGRTLFEVRMEKSVPEGQLTFSAPWFRVREARSERGFLVLKAEKGVRLRTEPSSDLREVHTGSLPLKVPDAQQAFRFKTGDWRLVVTLEKTVPSIHAELFQLVSLGDAALFGSCSLTYHISGAPVRALKLRIPEACQNIEFSGRDIRGWEKTGQLWQVSFQEKVLGDYTLLITYDQPLSFEGGPLTAGGIETVGTESEVGYLALAGAASLTLDPAAPMDPSLLEIDRAEIPQAYALLINDPVIRAYKYVGAPHLARLNAKRYSTRPLLSQVADHTVFATRISKEGEAITVATYNIKNASQQYLGVILPRDVRLWAARVDQTSVQVLAMKDRAGGVLIPLQRHRDPNQGSRVELVYAQSQVPLGFNRWLAFHAPVADSQAVFANWTVTLPEGYVLADARSNLMYSQPDPGHGFLRLLQSWGMTCGVLARGDAGWMGVLLILIGVSCWLLFRIGAGRVAAGSIVLSLGAVVGAVVSALMLDGKLDLFRHMVNFSVFAEEPVSWCFIRPVSLAGNEPSLAFRVMPAWIGVSGSVVAGIAGILGGLLVLGVSLTLGRVRLFLRGMGLSLLTFGLASFDILLPWIYAVFLLVVPAILIAGVLRYSWQLGRRRLPDALTPEPPPPLAPPGCGPDGEDGSGPSGAAVVASLLVVFLLGADPGQAAPVATNTPVSPGTWAPPPLLQSVDLQVHGPGFGRAENKVAKVTAVYAFQADSPAAFVVLPVGYVMTDYTLSSPNLTVQGDPVGYVLKVARPGSYRVELHYLMPVSEQEGRWRLPLLLPPNIRNQVRLQLPMTGIDIQAGEAVLLRVDEGAAQTEATAVFGTPRAPALTWRPQERKTKREKAVFFCEVNTLANFEAGVVHLQHVVRYQIAQGELQALSLQIPVGMRVTSVSAPGLSTWRFDPDSRQLEALLEKPVNSELVLTVLTQIPQEGVPYEVNVGALEIGQCARQRGALALVTPEAIQVTVSDLQGLNPMNAGDFLLEATNALPPGARAVNPQAVKRAFRYHQLPIAIKVRAEPVLPEIRVVEDARLDITDERSVLATKLNTTVARSGVFALALRLPADYEIEALTGTDVSHWDESREGDHTVRVHFDKQIMGTRTLNLVLTRTSKGVETEIAAPRVMVEGALKHTGVLVVSGERGVRFITARREGVSEINPGELGIAQTGYLAFKILRPDWTIALKTEVLAPVVRAEVLQRIQLAEGLIQGHGSIVYKIDNAGVKSFLVQSPQPGVALAVFGRNIVRAQEIDKTKGLWQVELQGKVETEYALEVSYQVACDPQAQTVKILPLRTVGTEAQKGYVVVMANPRLRVTTAAIPAGFKAEDARSIPAQFKAGDLSDAILCYRATQPDYALELGVVRHGSAAVLPAAVQRVRLESVLAEDDHMVTRVMLDLYVGNLASLKMSLPPESSIWAVFVNGHATPPLTEGASLRIPLDEATAGALTTVELLYGGCSTRRRWLGTHAIDGPKFDLPLTDIAWTFYVPPYAHYYGFGGSLNYDEPQGAGALREFDIQRYQADNAGEQARNRQNAINNLRQVEEFARKGQQKEAKKAFEAAMYYSQGQADFNEDVRVQYRNLAKQQAIVGLVDRRNNLRMEQNVQDEGQRKQMKGFNDGNWTPDYGKQVAQSLSAKDYDSLSGVADKIMEQQQAAAGVAQPIRITMPIHGRQLTFERQLQIDPAAAMSVSFNAFGDRELVWVWVALGLIGLTILYRVTVASAAIGRP